ncbi:metallophosphoesterase [Bythopirellula polymerisocia]|uniref:Serine/threonine-protein phosphatase 1 n=1 Tax=Bythopirellula polymerisocia TaxID=2528003 RepID=A0A5C6CDT4_9BACT|nr:metallophosphoesterase [Bythopirellula polymerisocia]TWU21917.1 Serine/threonine-protein phosphatase 1 [Bythopirellula polymerisocia]
MSLTRTIAIGDIHGCYTALDTLLAAIELGPEDRFVVLGDIVDRGPGSCAVIERLMQLRDECELLPILGNHEQMLLDAVDSKIALQDWLSFGGAETLDSYGKGAGLSVLPQEHVDYLRTWPDYHETPSHFFAHGNYLANVKLAEQPWQWLRWESLRDLLPLMHVSGKTAVLGHTSNKQGEILNLGYLVCIDTYCHGGGWLTALEPETGKIWQTNKRGDVREGLLPPPQAAWR